MASIDERLKSKPWYYDTDSEIAGKTKNFNLHHNIARTALYAIGETESRFLEWVIDKDDNKTHLPFVSREDDGSTVVYKFPYLRPVGSTIASKTLTQYLTLHEAITHPNESPQKIASILTKQSLMFRALISICIEFPCFTFECNINNFLVDGDANLVFFDCFRGLECAS